MCASFVENAGILPATKLITSHGGARRAKYMRSLHVKVLRVKAPEARLGYQPSRCGVRLALQPVALAMAALVAAIAFSPHEVWGLEDTLTITTTPASDGCLMDTREVWQNDPTKVVGQSANSADAEFMVAYVGSVAKMLSVAILEFPLPPKNDQPSAELISAELVVSINQGAEADEHATATLDVDIYGYDGTTADGAVDSPDWLEGKKLGRWLTKEETVIGYGAPMPAFDVTEFVKAALAAGKPFVGFRLQADGVEQGIQQCLIVRTAEFGASNGACYTPKLVLKY